jgi:hypothetical protein
MDELLLTLGYKYHIDRIKIEIVRELYLVEAGHKINQMPGQILQYNGGRLAWTANNPPLWSYVTEFGDMYEKFLMYQQQSHQQAIHTQQQALYTGQMNHSIQGSLTINQTAFNNHQFNYSQNVSGGLGITNPHAHTAVTSVGIGSSADSYPRAQGIWGSIKGIFSSE